MGSRQQGYKTLRELAGTNLISPADDYATERSALKFGCIDCGNQYTTTAYQYKKSVDGKRCIHCKRKLAVNSPSHKDEFIRRCEAIHGLYYTYSKIADTFSATNKITVTCPKHGDFEITADQHSRGSGCTHCKIDKVTQANRSNVTDFIVKANAVHNHKYDYRDVVYVNAITQVTIKCAKHGEFLQTPDVHLRGSGCKLCTPSSRPILDILQTLDVMGISYATEKMLDGCVGYTGRLLRFDIYIPDRNMCIEYDGPHHYGPVKYGNMTMLDAQTAFDVQQYNDGIKDAYCEDRDIRLIRIPHTMLHPAAFVRQYLTQDIQAERYMYKWDELNSDVARLAHYIKSFGYNKFAVYGIARGGVMFSIPLSYHFDGVCEYGVVTFQRYDGNSKNVSIDIQHKTPGIPIFVIDDLISSGITMGRVCKSLQHKFKSSTIHPVVIFGEENDTGVHFIHPHPKQWIVFPYEL